MAVDLDPSKNVGQWLEIIGQGGTKGYRNSLTGAQITPQQFGELVAAAKNAVQSKRIDPLGPFGQEIHPSVKQLAEIDTKRIPGYKPETQILMDSPMLPGVGAGVRALSGAARRALPNAGSVAETIPAPSFQQNFRAQQAAGRVGTNVPFREADVVGRSQLPAPATRGTVNPVGQRGPIPQPAYGTPPSNQLPAPSTSLPTVPNLPPMPPNKVGVPPSLAANAAGMAIAANASDVFDGKKKAPSGQNQMQQPSVAAVSPSDQYDPSQDPMYQNLMPSLPTAGVAPTQAAPTSKQGKGTAGKAMSARDAGALAAAQSAASIAQSSQRGAGSAPAPTDTSVVPNTSSGRPDYKYYADMLNAADSNDAYYRDFLNLRNQARAAAREAAASNMRYQFVPIRDDRANRIYFVNADGSDVVLDMGKPEDVREYRRVAEKIGIDINHMSDWMDRSSKPLARYNMPPGTNADTTPDFGFWRKLPSTKAEGEVAAAPRTSGEPGGQMPTPSSLRSLDIGKSPLQRMRDFPLEQLGQRIGSVADDLSKFDQPYEPSTTSQERKQMLAELEAEKAGQARPAAAPQAPSAPMPVGQSTRMMEMRRGPGVGEMDPPTVSPLRQPQPQAFTPRAQAQMAMWGMPQFGTEQIPEDAYQVGKYEMATPLPGHSALAGSQASKGNLAERDYWRKENMRAEREALELPEGIPLQPKPYVQPDEDILRFRPLRPLRDY
jgi:hypothetical protein